VLDTFLIRPDGRRTIGYSDETPGGYGEYMRLTEDLLIEVPNGLAAENAALAEPMAVGFASSKNPDLIETMFLLSSVADRLD
jgi:threonine dehydrogenase-like Zn-dependent dehydrogenase